MTIMVPKARHRHEDEHKYYQQKGHRKGFLGELFDFG